MWGRQHPSTGRYSLDTHHASLDQRLNAIAKADLGEDVGAINAGLWRRVPGLDRRSRQPRGRPTGGHKTDVIVLPSQT